MGKRVNFWKETLLDAASLPQWVKNITSRFKAAAPASFHSGKDSPLSLLSMTFQVLPNLTLLVSPMPSPRLT